MSFYGVLTIHDVLFSADQPAPSNGGNDRPAIWTIRAPSDIAEHYFIEAGKPVRLICVSPDGSPMVWERTDGPLPQSAQINGGELYITSPVVSDTGRYVCRSPQNPSAQHDFQFTVIGNRKYLFFAVVWWYR